MSYRRRPGSSRRAWRASARSAAGPAASCRRVLHQSRRPWRTRPRSVARVERKVNFGNGTGGVVSLNEPLLRYPDNPILTSHQVNDVWREPDRQVVTVHNAGVTRWRGETVMLFRSHLRSGVSVIGQARSGDGVGGWRVHAEPFLAPASGTDACAPGTDPAAMARIESGGVEDPRINVVDDTFAITYSGYDAEVRNQVRVCLATTDDFASTLRYGPVLGRDMRNVVIFPE